MSRVEEALSEVLSNGYQIQPDAFELLKNISQEYDPVQLVKTVINHKNSARTIKLITKDDFQRLIGEPVPTEIFDTGDIDCRVNIISDSRLDTNIVEGVEGYKALFNSRFSKLMKIVNQRQDSSQIQKITRINSNNKSVKIAGLIIHRKIKRDDIEIIIEDDTDKLTLYAADDGIGKRLSEVLLDQLVIADIVSNKQGRSLIKSVYSPDIPDKVFTTSKKNAYVVFTSDLHIGSNKFMASSFERFLRWVSGQFGDLDVIRRIVCLVIAGDSINGSRINSGFGEDLVQQDIFAQYEILYNYLNILPNSIKIIIIPGEHDITREALPQPPMPERFIGKLYDMENVMVLGNPSQFTVNGVNIISYHGSSFDDVVATVPGLSISKPAQAMKILLRARHLAQYYGGKTQIAPETEDRLVIDQVPDVLHAGHLHVVDLESYRGSVIINSGTLQAQTTYQETMGINPTPGIVPMMNLSNLEVFTKNFIS